MFGNDKTQQTSDNSNDNSNGSYMGTQTTNNGLMGLENQAANQPTNDGQVPTNLTDNVMPPTAPAITSADNNVGTPVSGDNNNLMDIKKEALMELSPLVHQLDQSADENFETFMMMIQASDNKSLIPQAFEAAKNISDDKKRARALLDVINEINYFNQKENKA